MSDDATQQTTRYRISLPMAGWEDRRELCTCDSAESVTEIIGALLRAGKGAPPNILIEVVYA